jgi:adenosylmethionine-8-amino-7-oxononanoate aminotransferase
MTGDERRRSIVAADKRHVWHPYTAMDAYAEIDPIVVARASGVWLEDLDGTRYIDGNSSWWVASLGHGHPRLLARLREQAETLAHCSLAGTTHEPAARLAEELVAIAPPGLTRVFYTDNGSTSVEVALRMALQAWQQRGVPGKNRFLAIDGAFHGDTLGAASLGGVEVFRRAIAGVVLDCVRAPFPEEGGSDAGYVRAFEQTRAIVEREKNVLAAVVVEPIVQGAAGMRMYDPALLRELRALCDANDVFLVVDEVFTGYGRTGTMWAVEQAGVSPDLMCLGKAFASLVPMGATLASERVLDAFRGTRESALHYGHTFCGNPIGAALAREVLAIYRDEAIVDGVAKKAPRIARAFASIAELPGVARVRTRGMIGAADLAVGGTSGGYLGDLGWRVYDEARKRGAYLRPLGDTVYVTPPLTITNAELDVLLGIVRESIEAVLARVS